jgi:two-component system nitrogen regulation response regulator GlnG
MEPRELNELQAEAGPSGVQFVIRTRIEDQVRGLYAEVHGQLDRLVLPRVLEHTGGSQHQAALLLGIARETLRRKLRELELSDSRPAGPEADDQV